MDGRLFKSYRPEYLQLLFERVGFQQIGRWDSGDALGRTGTRWYTLDLKTGAAQFIGTIGTSEAIRAVALEP